jgi:hypothetical protein
MKAPMIMGRICLSGSSTFEAFPSDLPEKAGVRMVPGECLPEGEWADFALVEAIGYERLPSLYKQTSEWGFR